jgi:hypothetical protein
MKQARHRKLSATWSHSDVKSWEVNFTELINVLEETNMLKLMLKLCNAYLYQSIAWHPTHIYIFMFLYISNKINYRKKSLKKVELCDVFHLFVKQWFSNIWGERCFITGILGSQSLSFWLYENLHFHKFLVAAVDPGAILGEPLFYGIILFSLFSISFCISWYKSLCFIFFDR